MKFIRFIPPTHLILLTTSILTAGSALATDHKSETTIVLNASQEVATYTLPQNTSLVSTSGTLHGTLIEFTDHLEYLPDASFWAAGSDVTLVHVTRNQNATGRLKRIRWVAGHTAYDQTVTSMTDPGSGNWQPWTVYSPTGNEVEIVTGVASPEAYQLSLSTPESDHASIYKDIPFPAGGTDQTTTTTEVSAVMDDIEKYDWETADGVRASILRWHHGQQVIAELEIRRDESQDNTGPLLIRPWSPLDDTANGAILNSGYNHLRLVRYNSLTQSRAQFFINGALVDTIDTPTTTPEMLETHELLLNGNASTTQNLNLRFEDPTSRRSHGSIDPTTRLIYENFSGPWRSRWSQTEGGRAMDRATQTPSGIGRRLEIDLSQIAPGGGSYAEREVRAAEDPLELNPKGYGVRFQFDPTAVSLPLDRIIELFSACPVTNNSCVGTAVTLGRTDSNLTITAVTRRDDGQTTTISAPVSMAPHTVHLRLKNAATQAFTNGWIEVWVDGVLIGRADHLANFHQQPWLLRFGAVAKASGLTGILGLDEFEAWRFD